MSFGRHAPPNGAPHTVPYRGSQKPGPPSTAASKAASESAPIAVSMRSISLKKLILTALNTFATYLEASAERRSVVTTGTPFHGS